MGEFDFKTFWSGLDESTRRLYAKRIYDLAVTLQKVRKDNETRLSINESPPSSVASEYFTLKPKNHRLEFHGEILERGFWLYIWQVTAKSRDRFYYVGRTGDSSSINAQSPFNRMGQHLGFAKNSNMLRKYLGNAGVKLEECKFKLVSHGPIFSEAKERDLHVTRRDNTAGLEKALADAMVAAGYTVMNKVKSSKLPDPKILLGVIEAFSKDFPKLSFPSS